MFVISLVFFVATLSILLTFHNRDSWTASRAQEACRLDADGEYEQAFVLYKRAVQYLLTAVKYEKNERSKV